MHTILFILITFVSSNSVKSAHPINVPIGCIFEGTDQDNEIVLRVAVDMVNNAYKPFNYHITPVIVNIEPDRVIDMHETVIGITWDRPYEVLDITCTLLNTGVVGILSIVSENNANTIQSVCDAKEIPFVRTTPNIMHERDCCSINIFPSTPVLAKAFADLVQEQDWSTFTVMYESEDGFADIAKILKLYDTSGHLLVLEQLRKNSYGDYRNVLKKIRDSGQKNFVLHCDTANLNEILEQIQQVGLMRKHYNYIITDLDMHTINLRRYQHSEVNIISIVNPTTPNVIRLVEAMNKKRKELNLQVPQITPLESARKLKVSTALLVDAIMLYVEALMDIGSFNTDRLKCNSSTSWDHGSTVLNYLKMKTMYGLTGLVQFDYYGLRSDFVLDVLKLEETGIKIIGSWSSKTGYNSFKDEVVNKNTLWDKSINVMITWNEPYALYKNESALLEGNNQYEGFVVDLVSEISLLEGFNYTLIRNEDDKNGDYDETTKTWNGMIGDILSGVGDIAIGDITITRQRQDFVDFTTPFMSAGIQILYPKYFKPTPAFFSFAGPFAPNVWQLIIVSYFLVSIALYIMARFCPMEWDNWDRCVQEPAFYVNQFNVRNSLWYMLGCLSLQGADIYPRSISTRVLASVWAIFILVIVSYYKAQLAASLTIEVDHLPFENIEELVEKADQLGIVYGTIENEVIHQFFMKSPNELHQKIAAYMADHPKYMVEDNFAAYLLAKEMNYAFFTDSVFAGFVETAACTLAPIGKAIHEQHFAIALRKNSPYRAALSNSILKLLESGKVKELQTKWWEYANFKEEGCENKESSTIAPPLNYGHVAGIFWITIGGTLLACVFVFVELLLHICKKCGRNRREVMLEFSNELRFYFSSSSPTKPVRNGRIVDES